MEWRFSLDGIEIAEPQGFSEISFNVMRDEKWHGVFFEASTTKLSFYGEAFDILKTAKESYGVDAEVIFKAESRCDGSDWETVIEGKLDFSGYQETCGNECLVKMSVEQATCAMVFKNRFDQKVNIDSNIAFNKATVLQDYAGLGFDMELATQEIPISADADVNGYGDTSDLGPFLFQIDTAEHLFIRPVYEIVTDNSILTGQLSDPQNFFQDPDTTFSLSPQVLLEELQSCINSEFDYNIRMKGNVSVGIDGVGDIEVMIRVVMDLWDGFGVLNIDGTEIHTEVLTTDAVNLQNYPFDFTWAGSIAIPEGMGVYAYIQITLVDAPILGQAIIEPTYNFDGETSFYLSNIKACPPTNAEVYLVNETLARAAEAITDRCLTIQSDYYGRTDSQPYASTVDGCGSLRVVTPGLKIRQAPDKQFFASMKELMEGLRAIDNIGMGMEADRVRIEPARYFYQDTKILDLPLIPKALSGTEEGLVYSNIKYGYNKWEIKSIKGIDEFNSLKESRTGIKSVSNQLDISSNLITAGYIIEDLRTKTLLNTGNTDSTYDNDVFLICVDRDAYGFHVEQGIAENAANFFSPATAYNWRVRPIYNLMRWFKSIAQSYVSLINTTSKLFFTSGTGNYLAEGNISPYDICRLENKVLAENDDLHITDFDDVSEGTPIYKPETVTFEYPLSIADYKLIKETPYGYLNVQCGNGTFYKAYIKNIEYKPSEGMANFNLIKAWQ